MKKSSLRFLPLLAVLTLILPPSAWADPCGMVPPISFLEGRAIERVGLQRTYVFYKKGYETFVIRPGFKGKVDNFGMLIPFPTPPAIRKVPDDIFSHVAKAIDPPEVVIDLRLREFAKGGRRMPMASAAGKKEKADKALGFNEVKVIREEAVGMYDVAVLDAGSAQALKRWMDEHGYKFPKGMDKVCNEYVDAKWCFVAVKTRVGNKKAVNPKAGMKEVDPKLPKGSTFDGSVQAMGFRFKVKELVVPMRLSAFNDGDLRNVVYILSDGPRKIRNIPEQYVVRQVDGKQLYKNVTSPLPLRVIGGTLADIPEWQKKTLKQRRDQKPHNGFAKSLFAADLLAVQKKQLSNPFEEREKDLLRIDEYFELRSSKMDSLRQEATSKERDEATKYALEDLHGMTLTVVDGDFPREVISSENLTFVAYSMPKDRNAPNWYDATTYGPNKQRRGFVVAPVGGGTRQGPGSGPQAIYIFLGLLAVLLVSAAGLALRGLSRMGKFSVWPRRIPAAASVLLTLSVLTLSSGWAEDKSSGASKVTAAQMSKASVKDLLKMLDDPKKSAMAVKVLVNRGESAVPELYWEASESESILRRGWAIVCLSQIGGEKTGRILRRIADDKQSPLLVRTWAAGAVIKSCDSKEELLKHASWMNTLPAVTKSFAKKLTSGLAGKTDPESVEKLLTLGFTYPQIRGDLMPVVEALGVETLLKIMYTSSNQQVRWYAASYIGGLAQKDKEAVSKKTIAALAFQKDAAKEPWAGGPLYIPGLQWEKKDAQAMVGHLIHWMKWAEAGNNQNVKNVIFNNLRSLSLLRAAGIQQRNMWNWRSARQWEDAYAKVAGASALSDLLASR